MPGGANFAGEGQDHPTVRVDRVIAGKVVHAGHGDVETVAGGVAHGLVARGRGVLGPRRAGKNEIRRARRRADALGGIAWRQSALLAGVGIRVRRLFRIEQRALFIARNPRAGAARDQQGQQQESEFARPRAHGAARGGLDHAIVARNVNGPHVFAGRAAGD